MSFFKKLRGALDKIEDVKHMIDGVTNATVHTDTVPERPVASTTTDIPSTAAEQTYSTDDAYFASLITEDSFVPYTIERNVAASRLEATAHPKCYPISYLFMKDSKPVLAVLIMNKNQYRSMIAKGTYQVLDKQGIPYIRFFKGMKNEREYVLDRIRDHL